MCWGWGGVQSEEKRGRERSGEKGLRGPGMGERGEGQRRGEEQRERRKSGGRSEWGREKQR